MNASLAGFAAPSQGISRTPSMAGSQHSGTAPSARADRGRPSPGWTPPQGTTPTSATSALFPAVVDVAPHSAAHSAPFSAPAISGAASWAATGPASRAASGAPSGAVSGAASPRRHSHARSAKPGPTVSIMSPQQGPSEDPSPTTPPAIVTEAPTPASPLSPSGQVGPVPSPAAAPVSAAPADVLAPPPPPVVVERNGVDLATRTRLGLLLVDIRAHAARAERTLADLQAKVAAADAEIDRRRAQMRLVVGEDELDSIQGLIQTGQAAAVIPAPEAASALSWPEPELSERQRLMSERTEMLGRRLTETDAEIKRNLADKTRLLRTLDAQLAGPHDTTLTSSEAAVFASAGPGGSSHKSAASALRSLLLGLPPPNVAQLDEGHFFRFAKETLAAATAQLRKYKHVDPERVTTAGLAQVGYRLPLSVIKGDIAEADFDKL